MRVPTLCGGKWRRSYATRSLPVRWNSAACDRQLAVERLVECRGLGPVLMIPLLEHRWAAVEQRRISLYLAERIRVKDEGMVRPFDEKAQG